MSDYGQYRARCTKLENDLLALRSKIPIDRNDATIEYLLEVGSAMLVAAKVLIEARLDSKFSASPATKSDAAQG